MSSIYFGLERVSFYIISSALLYDIEWFVLLGPGEGVFLFTLLAKKGTDQSRE